MSEGVAGVLDGEPIRPSDTGAEPSGAPQPPTTTAPASSAHAAARPMQYLMPVSPSPLDGAWRLPPYREPGARHECPVSVPVLPGMSMRCT